MPKKPVSSNSLANLNPLAASKPEEEKKSVLLKIYVTPAKAAIIRRDAEAAGMSVSDYLQSRV